jgi:hypothetical protein
MRGGAEAVTIAMQQEVWFVSRMREHGAPANLPDPFQGVTEPTLRRDRIREWIRELGLAQVIIGCRNGKSETYQQAFERLYGEPLRKPTPEAHR